MSRRMNPQRRCVLCCLAVYLALAGRAKAQSTPATELHAALNDLESLPAEVRASCRYLSLYSIPEQDQSHAAKVLSYTVNLLSRTRAITQIHWVSDTLARINILDYAPTAGEFKDWAAAWETLGINEPRWHIRTEVAEKIIDKKGVVTKGPTKIVTVDGGWVGLDCAQKLKLLTASNAPILEAGYFVSNATLAPVYYQFTGIPDNDVDFLKSIGVDEPTIERLRANAGANLVQSEFTRKPRRIVWAQGPMGGVYETLDVEQVTADRDPIRRPVSSEGFNVNYDAGEWFVVGPNGLWRTAVFDSKNKRLDTVVDKIAKDNSEPLGDGIVHAAQSCLRCHIEGGLRPFRDSQAKLLAKNKAELQSYDPNIVRRAVEFYDEPRLQRQMSFDRETYKAACALATGGMEPLELATAYAKVVRDYQYAAVTVTQAALECGVDEKEFKAAVVNTHDPYLLILVDNGVVLRGQWDSSFAEAITSCEARRER